jgi:hypothetical protein
VNVSPSAGGAFDLDDADDVVITSPADGDVLTYDSASGDWVNASPAGGGGGSSLFWEAATVGSYDDYFDADNSTDWTAVAVTGTATWNYNFADRLGSYNRGLVTLFEDQTAQDYPAYLKSLSGITTGDYIQTCSSIFRVADSVFCNTGVAFTDGTSTTSNVVFFGVSMTNTELYTLACGHGTLTATSTFPIDLTMGSGVPSVLHVRLTYSASNTFQCYVSLNGENWQKIGADVSKTMTPTHGGFIVSTFGAGEPRFVQYRYFHSNVTP